MRIYFLILSITMLMFSCKNGESETTNNLQDNSNKIVVEEVHFTSNYTYLYGDVNGEKTWLAVPKMDAKVGDVYYYDGGMLMQNFVSKELNRTFEKIWFLEGVRTTEKPVEREVENIVPHDMKPKLEKQDVKITVPEGGISIAELFSNKEKYNGQSVIVKGIVAKFNPQIMDRNWIHIQDGTDHQGEFDLTITSLTNVKVGDTIIVEGKIALNKDFGYGYSYDIIMEDAVIK